VGRFLPAIWRGRRQPQRHARPATVDEPAPTIEALPCWALIAHTNDLHINSTVALCPPKFPRDDGGIYYPSKAQRWIWDRWLEFWDTVQARQRAMQAEAPPGVRVPLFVILNGDLVDINKHSAVQLIEAENPVPILDAAEAALDRPLRMADTVFVNRGTEAHSGGVGYLEEELAKRIDAEPNPDTGTSSWFHLVLGVAGVLGDFCHHPATSSRRPWLLDSAAARQASIVWDEYHEGGEEPPQVVGRAHVHQFARGWRADTFCFFSPSWQITTAFGRRIGAGRRVAPLGGVIIECRDGVAEVEPMLYRAEPGAIWQPAPEVYRQRDGSWTIQQ